MCRESLSNKKCITLERKLKGSAQRATPLYVFDRRRIDGWLIGWLAGWIEGLTTQSVSESMKQPQK